MKYRIRKIRKKLGLKQKDLVDKTGLSNPYLSALETGNVKKSPSDDTLISIAQALGVRVSDLYDDAPLIPTMGHVGAGAEVSLPEDITFHQPMYYVACPPRLRPDNVVAVEVKGDSMWPVMNEGDLLFYERDHEGVAVEAINKTCVCEDTEGNVWVKRVEAGSEGKFNLVSLNPTTGLMVNVALRYAAPVLLHWPLALVERIED